MLLLGEMAAFLAGWHPALQAVARSFAATAARWADDSEAEAAAAPPQNAVKLRAQQAKLRMTALCCYGGSGGAALSSDDAAAMLRLAVLVHHGSIYCHALDGEDTAELQAQLSQLEVRWASRMPCSGTQLRYVDWAAHCFGLVAAPFFAATVAGPHRRIVLCLPQHGASPPAARLAHPLPCRFCAAGPWRAALTRLLLPPTPSPRH